MCFSKNESRIVFEPVGTEIAGLSRLTSHASVYGAVVHAVDGLFASVVFVQLQLLDDVVQPFAVSKSSEKSVTCVPDDVGSGMAQAPRERVNTASVVAPRSIEKLQIIVFGRPFWKRSHDRRRRRDVVRVVEAPVGPGEDLLRERSG